MISRPGAGCGFEMYVGTYSTFPGGGGVGVGLADRFHL